MSSGKLSFEFKRGRPSDVFTRYAGQSNRSAQVHGALRGGVSSRVGILAKCPVLASSRFTEQDGRELQRPGHAPPAFTLPDQESTDPSLADHAGTAVLGYFFSRADHREEVMGTCSTMQRYRCSSSPKNCTLRGKPRISSDVTFLLGREWGTIFGSLARSCSANAAPIG